MEIFGYIFFIGTIIFFLYHILKAVYLLFDAIFSVFKSIFHDRKVKKVRELQSKYPYAIREVLKNVWSIDSMSDTALDNILNTSKREWEQKNNAAYDKEQKERAERETKYRNSRTANEYIVKYPDAVRRIIGKTKDLTDEQNAELCKYTVSEISSLDQQIKEEKKKKQEEFENKYKHVTTNYPNGLELVKKLRAEKHLDKDLYTDTEYALIQSGLSVSSTKARLLMLPDSTYAKYENISKRNKFYVDWQQRQVAISKKARNLGDQECDSWGMYPYSTHISGINELGEEQDYKFTFWQLFKNSFGLSDNVPYTHLQHCLSTRRNLSSFKTGNRTFVEWVYDEMFNFINSLSTNVSVIICDSKLGEEWENIESTHFSYIIGKFKEHQINHIKFSDVNAARNLLSKTIVILELITENSHMIDICDQIYSTIDGATIVYISLLKEHDESELLKQHNTAEKKIKEEAEKLRKEQEEAERKAKEEKERKIREEAQRKEQEEKDRLYRLSHTFKTNSAEFKRHLTTNGVRYFYHFTDKRNLESIRKMGGLYSWQYCEDHNIEIARPGGDSTSRSLDRRHGLQDYVRVSFCTDHPMKWILEQQGYDMVLLKVKIDVACLEGTLFSDINATDNNHHHGGSLADLQRINIPATQQNFVSRESDIFKQHQAEVMVKTFIPLEYIEMPNITPIRKIYDDDLPF